MDSKKDFTEEELAFMEKTLNDMLKEIQPKLLEKSPSVEVKFEKEFKEVTSKLEKVINSKCGKEKKDLESFLNDIKDSNSISKEKTKEIETSFRYYSDCVKKNDKGFSQIIESNKVKTSKRELEIESCMAKCHGDRKNFKLNLKNCYLQCHTNYYNSMFDQLESFSKDLNTFNKKI